MLLGVGVGKREGVGLSDDGSRDMREVLPGQESEGAMGKHLGGEIADDGKGLGVQVAEHGVGAPASDEFNDVGVDTGA